MNKKLLAIKPIVSLIYNVNYYLEADVWTHSVITMILFT